MGSQKRLRVGLIGVGAVGAVHVKAYQKATRIEVVAIAEASPERRAAAEVGPSVKRYADAEEMLSKERPDIACVLTHVPMHEPLVLLCAKHKVHVLCEKPLTLSLASAERMLKTTRDAGVRLSYGSSYRHLPTIKAARSIIGSGGIGHVRLMREQALGGKGAAAVQTFPLSHYPAGGPGGFPMGIVDHGVHLIDVFGLFTGSEVRSVIGRGNVSGEAPGPEFLDITYESGALGQLVYDEATFPTDLPGEGLFSLGQGWDLDGFVAAGQWTRYPGTIHVYGTEGSLRIFHYANLLYRIDKNGIRQIPVEGLPSPYHFAAQIDCFAEDITTGRPTTTPGEVGVEALKVMLAAYPGAMP
jgi:predicted dehydrogenase